MNRLLPLFGLRSSYLSLFVFLLLILGAFTPVIAQTECACIRVNVTMDANCKFKLALNLVTDGNCTARVVVKDTDQSNGDIIDCPGTWEYVLLDANGQVRCWNYVVAEDKTGPKVVTTYYDNRPIYCFEANFILNNPKTIGRNGMKEGITQTPNGNTPGHTLLGGTSNDEIFNLGLVTFDDGCRSCGCAVTTKWSDRLVTYGCDSLAKNGLWGRVFREWVGTDCRGNSTNYTQVYELRRPPISLFQFKDAKPEGKYDHQVTYQSCTADKSLIKKEDWMPRIPSSFFSSTEPKYERWFPLDEVECNYSVQIKDTEFPVCEGKGLKIDREIYIFDWCAGKVIDTLHVLIKIGDFSGPTLAKPSALVVISTGPAACTASLPITAARLKSDLGINISDNCGLANVSVKVKTRDRIVKGIVIATNVWDLIAYPTANGVMSGLPQGRHRLIIDAFDGCYNAMKDSLEFEVVDKIAPVMKCDDELNVTLSNANGYLNGYAKVTAEDINEGSWDNCELLWIKVRRNYNADCKDDLIAKGYDLNGDGKLDEDDGFEQVNGKWMTPLADFVEFFCCDVTEEVTVELWGQDRSKNRSFCWMNLNIEDKVAPTCMAPDDITILCTDKNLGLIEDKKRSAIAFGDVRIMSGNDCAALDTTYRVVKNLKCGYGTIERIWTLTKKTSKGDLSTECRQIITIRPVFAYTLCFPKDVEVRDCKAPFIDTLIADEQGCDILAVNVTDKRYDAADGECYKIFRTYTVIDWCAYDEKICGPDPMAPGIVNVVPRNPSNQFNAAINFDNPTNAAVFSRSRPIYVLIGDFGEWFSLDLVPNNSTVSNHSGTSKTYNDIKIPVNLCNERTISHSWMYTQIIKVYDDVAPEISFKRDTICTDPASCLAKVRIPFKAKDNCSERIELERTLVMLAPFQTTTGPYIMSNSKDYTFSFEDDGKGNMAVSVTNVPEGLHDLIVVVRDACGNLTRPTRIPFFVKDCKAPAPICVNGLSAELMPDGNGSGMITVWANDFVASKIFDCNGQGPETQNGQKLVTKYSINRLKEPVKQDQTSLTFTCADKDKTINVEIHAWDNKGNHDFCITYVLIQDNRKVCPSGSGSGVEGDISTDDGKPVPGVDVNLGGSTQDQQKSNGSGLYKFNNLLKGGDYSIAPKLDKDVRNGVTTFDLVIIQKHILGINPITSPFRQIAADVNGSNSITTIDLIQIRKLILNVDDSFKGSPSWKFIDSKYKFSDPSNPWKTEISEVVNINNINGNVEADFVAVKMGDVNGSVVPAGADGFSSGEVRSGKTWNLSIQNQTLQIGQIVEVPILAKDLAAVQGFQFTLQVNGAEILGIEPGMLSAENLGVFAQENLVTASWTKMDTKRNEAALFTLKLRAKGQLGLKDALKISSRLTPQEAYGASNELMDVILQVNQAPVHATRFQLLQNQPNPFREETNIGFYLPNAAKATLTVRDVKGSLVYRFQGEFGQGQQQITLSKADLKAASGVLYYTLETADFTETKKMVLLGE
jgi:large repetitive protein